MATLPVSRSVFSLTGRGVAQYRLTQLPLLRTSASGEAQVSSRFSHDHMHTTAAVTHGSSTGARSKAVCGCHAAQIQDLLRSEFEREYINVTRNYKQFFTVLKKNFQSSS